MRCMTLCTYLGDVLYAIATDLGTIVMVQGFGFSMKIRSFTIGLICIHLTSCCMMSAIYSNMILN
jgi:hypothetical protein